MIELIDGMYLYHDSYTAVEYIDLPKCERCLILVKVFILRHRMNSKCAYPLF